jgi:general secretion pathway protein D
LTLDYDPAVLRALDVTDGGFLAQSGAPSQFNKDLGTGSGAISFTLGSAAAAGASGAGVVASAVFEVLSAAGPTQLKASRAVATDTNGVEIPVNAGTPFTLETMQ